MTLDAQIDSGGAVYHDNPDWFPKVAQAGIEVICISPVRSDVTSQVVPEWVPIKPNTDTALMLGLAHTLVINSLHDRAFLDRFCAGYPEFEHYLLGHIDHTPKDAAWASHITGVPAEIITQLAQRMVQPLETLRKRGMPKGSSFR